MNGVGMFGKSHWRVARAQAEGKRAWPPVTAGGPEEGVTLGVISEVESVRLSSVGEELGVRETTVMCDLGECADTVPSK